MSSTEYILSEDCSYLYTENIDDVMKKRNKFVDDIQIATDVCGYIDVREHL